MKGKRENTLGNYEELEKRVATLEVAVKSIILQKPQSRFLPMDRSWLRKEVMRRGFTDDPHELKRIENIISEYPDLTPEEITRMFDKMRARIGRDVIDNVCGYVFKAFLNEFPERRKGTAP